uniref:Uncharacterized protein n=1 Tax=Rhizophora mucronata TaxID=61149 RepID=A0A2P2NXM4_RHIMU
MKTGDSVASKIELGWRSNGK